MRALPWLIVIAVGLSPILTVFIARVIGEARAPNRRLTAEVDLKLQEDDLEQCSFARKHKPVPTQIGNPNGQAGGEPGYPYRLCR